VRDFSQERSAEKILAPRFLKFGRSFGSWVALEASVMRSEAKAVDRQVERGACQGQRAQNRNQIPGGTLAVDNT
jgi:hypothetical protein